jgi:hypothetical protein
LTGELTGKLVDLQLDFINRGQLVLLVLINISVLCQLSGVLDVVGLLGELPGVVGRVTNVDVVDFANHQYLHILHEPRTLTQNIIRHRPELESDTAQGLKVRRVHILIVVRVRDLSRVPFALVRRVLLLGSDPLALQEKRRQYRLPQSLEESAPCTQGS